jgi:hypothetical protein
MAAEAPTTLGDGASDALLGARAAPCLGPSPAGAPPPPPPLPSPRASLDSSLTALPAPCTTLEPPMDTRSISSLMLLSVWGRWGGGGGGGWQGTA